MYRRAASLAPASATTAASSVVGSSGGAGAASAAGKAGTNWGKLRQNMVLQVASVLPASERRAIMDQWAAEGDETCKVLKEAEGQLASMRADVQQAKAAEASALAEMERLR